MTTHLLGAGRAGTLPSDPVFTADRLDPRRPVHRDRYGVWLHGYCDVEAVLRSEAVTLDMTASPGFDPEQAHPALLFMWATDVHTRADGTPGRQHTWRELLQPWIGAPGVPGRRAAIERVATANARALPPAFDVYTDYATTVTTRIIADLVGITPREVTWLLDRQREHPTFVELAAIPDQPDVVRMLAKVLQRSDRFGFLRAVGDSDLNDAEARAAIWGLVQAGTLNAAATITGTVGLAVQTGRWPLPADTIGPAVEETIRFTTPFPVTHRFAVAPFQLPSGAQIAPGERLLLNLAAANRDPDGQSGTGPAFGQDRPLTEFDPTRTPNRHLGWSIGPHRCTGVALARAIAVAGVTALAQDRPELHLAGPWRRYNGTELGYLTAPVSATRT